MWRAWDPRFNSLRVTPLRRQKRSQKSLYCNTPYPSDILLHNLMTCHQEYWSENILTTHLLFCFILQHRKHKTNNIHNHHHHPPPPRQRAHIPIFIFNWSKPSVVFKATPRYCVCHDIVCMQLLSQCTAYEYEHWYTFKQSCKRYKERELCFQGTK